MTHLFLLRLGVDITEPVPPPAHCSVSPHLPAHVVDRVMAGVSGRRGIDVKSILHGGNRASFVEARHEVMWQLRWLGYSYPQIAAALGNDHCTVQRGCRRHAERAGVPHSTPKREAA